MDVNDKIANQLQKGAKTADELLAVLPELAHSPQGADVLRLLLRLDKNVRLLDNGRYTLTPSAQTPADRIVSEAQAFMAPIPGSGATLNSVIDHVVKQTGYAPEQVRAVLIQRFMTRGDLIAKKLK